MDAFILPPEFVSVEGNNFIQRQVQTNSTNSFAARTLVYLYSGALKAVGTAGVLIYGQTPDISHASTEYPPQAFFGQNHYVFDPKSVTCEINIGSVANTTDVTQGQAGSAPQPSSLTIGSSYGIYVPSTGTYAGVQFLDPTNTSNLLFEYLGLPDSTQPTDYNGRVRVKFVSGTIQ